MKIIVNETELETGDIILVSAILEGNAFPYFIIKFRGNWSKYMKPEGTIEEFFTKDKGFDYEQKCAEEISVIRDFVILYWKKSNQKLIQELQNQY